MCALALLAGACERSQPPAPAATSDTKPAASAAVESQPLGPLGAPTGTFIDRDSPTVLRVVTYNIRWNSIFEDVDPDLAAKFVRVIHALNPDILALQEIGVRARSRGHPDGRKHTAEDVLRIMDQAAALPHGAHWYAFQGGDDVIVSRYPLQMTSAQTIPPGEREQAIALVDLPDEQFGGDFYIFNEHFKCCGGETNDELRQRQADAVMSWIRDARTPGPHIDLPPGTALAIAGDLNQVGSPQPLQTLLTGDIRDEAQYGRKFAPDWDDTPFTDAHPLHNVAGPEDWTWRDDTDKYKPGRLDYIVYSDSVLEVVKKFVLNTTTMSEADLQATGLRKFDVTKDDVGKVYDHLPVVVDFRVTASALESGNAPME